MKDSDILQQAVLYGELRRRISGVYEEYAKSVGLSYTSLYILYLINFKENCTQKYISERMFLPKQTINTVITTFYKQGLVYMQELPEDRRNKSIHLSEKGKKYADKILPNIKEAEIEGMEKLTEDERKKLLELTERYANTFAHRLK